MFEDNLPVTMKNAPRVLVFGQPFNDFSGGGITLSNLFKGWPKDRIASLWAPWDDSGFSDDICDNYYKIGREERKWEFPFNLYKKPFPPSGPVIFSTQVRPHSSTIRPGVRNWFSNGIVNPFLHWIGLYHRSSSINLSTGLKKWLDEFNPEILYFQVSTLEGILFAGQLLDHLKIPSVIHMMDDWPSTISLNGPLKKIWNNRIDKRFRILLENVNLFLSISELMSEEYLKRYKKEFTAFHNPVDLVSFKTNLKDDLVQNATYKILYIGRIGTANKNSITQFANVISQMNSGTRQIEFHIYSKDYDMVAFKQFRNLSGVSLNPPVSHEKVPTLLSGFDLLLLPLDFTQAGLKFARLSIPTKATEYMLSGVPILVFAPEETAVSRFFRNHDCGFCLTQNSSDAIITSLDYLISNSNYRLRISKKAVKVAIEKFDAEKVRDRFRETLFRSVQQKNVL